MRSCFSGKCGRGNSIVAIIFSAALLTCCNGNNNAPRAEYYDIDSLVTAQIKYLTVSKATIKKVAMLGTQEAKTTINPRDTSAWIKELDIFRELKAINKPINRGAYQVEDGVLDSKSNLKIKSFTSKADLPVEYLKVYYHDTLDKVRKIEAKQTVANAMYTGSRYLIMEFQNINNKTLLTYYAIDGGQKMFLGDSVQYTVNASVSLLN